MLKSAFAGVLILAGGVASAALPPVVEGNPQSVARPAAGGVGMVEIYNRLQQLQQEVQTLRGELEEHSYMLDNINKRQRDLYMDLDRRIQALEGGGVRAPAPAASSLAPSESAPSANVPATTSNQGSEKSDYDQAFSLLKAGDYDKAAEAFSQFVTTYPQSGYVPNALYWLGEANYVTRKFEPAKSAFDQVIQQYPAHSKAKDAMLKVGYIHFENKDWNAAKQMLDNVVTHYPGSSAARLAQQRLDAIKQ